MKARIGKVPIEAEELRIINNVANNLYFLAIDVSLSHAMSEQLFAMQSALKTILLAHGKGSVETKTRKDGTLDQWPDGASEKWEAIK